MSLWQMSPTYTIDLHTKYVTCCTIWYQLYNFKKVKNTHGGVLILANLQASAFNFTKINTPQWVFFTFLKLYKWHQIVQRITYKGNIGC